MWDNCYCVWCEAPLFLCVTGIDSDGRCKGYEDTHFDPIDVKEWTMQTNPGKI